MHVAECNWVLKKTSINLASANKVLNLNWSFLLRSGTRLISVAFWFMRKCNTWSQRVSSYFDCFCLGDGCLTREDEAGRRFSHWIRNTWSVWHPSKSVPLMFYFSVPAKILLSLVPQNTPVKRWILLWSSISVKGANDFCRWIAAQDSFKVITKRETLSGLKLLRRHLHILTFSSPDLSFETFSF